MSYAPTLMICDMQNDFVHPDGAYARGGAVSAAVAALPPRQKTLADAVRKAGGWIVTTNFTLVPGRGGEPLIDAHLKKLRPFLRKGDFLPGGWGHATLDLLGPADFSVEKIAYSAFYQTRLEWVLRRIGAKDLIFVGIVTNGGVASTLRDAHVREFHCTLAHDGCAAPTPELHETAVKALAPVAAIRSIDEIVADLNGSA